MGLIWLTLGTITSSNIQIEAGWPLNSSLGISVAFGVCKWGNWVNGADIMRGNYAIANEKAGTVKPLAHSQEEGCSRVWNNMASGGVCLSFSLRKHGLIQAYFTDTNLYWHFSDMKYRYRTFTSIAILRYIEYRTSTSEKVLFLRTFNCNLKLTVASINPITICKVYLLWSTVEPRY